MNKRQFIEEIRIPRILLGAFDDQVFLTKTVRITLTKVKISDFGNYYNPWYYLDEKELGYEEARKNMMARAMQVKNTDLINLGAKRKNAINDMNIIMENLLPIVLAEDLNTNKTLILDGNKTSISLFRKFLDKKVSNLLIPAIVIKGHGLEDFIGDFKIVNRSLIKLKG